MDDSVHRIRDLRSTGFTLDQLDDELASMTLIQALPDDYNAFVSSLLLKDDLDKIAVQNAFVREDNQRKRCQDDSPTVGNALATSSTSSTSCTFCGFSGHSQDICRQYARAKDQFLKNRITKGKGKPNNTSNNSTSGNSFCIPGHRVCWQCKCFLYLLLTHSS